MMWWARISSAFLVVTLLTIVPVPANGAETLTCHDTTRLGDLAEAKCHLPMPSCNGSCPTYLFRVTVERSSGIDGAATVYVNGEVAGEPECSGIGSCAGEAVLTPSPNFDLEIPCSGYMADDFTDWHAATSLAITCERLTR